jgi:hypothetical protein
MHGQNQALPINSREWLTSEERRASSSDDKRLETDSAKHISRREGAAFWPALLNFAWREDIVERQPDSRENVLHIAATETVQKDSPVIKFADRQRGAAVSMGRATGSIFSVAGSLYLVET